MVELEIDDQKISVEEGTNVIDAAESIGIYIPRFCYHKKLSVVANCRMCLVEVEKVPKPLPACATTVTPGMKVYTKSKKALDAQRAVMEFLLINHPLDCPICDQGGECELQDQSVGFGNANSDYHRSKRSVASKNIGPLIATEMTRCIHCTRCIRVSEEICGVREMGATYRGGHMEIGTYVEKAISSELSGNMIDVCPVGALTSKPYSFQGRAWELQEHPMVAVHDCWGSNTYMHTRGREYDKRRDVMRVVPRENDAINEAWLSDRDRFAYLGLNADDRLTQPMVKENGSWQSVSWERALSMAADRLKAVIQMQGADQVGTLMSPSSSNEEFYLMQSLMRSNGCHNIDFRIRQNDFSDDDCVETFPGFSQTVEQLEQSDAILLVGCYLRHEVPLANYRVLKAQQEGAKVMSLAACRHDFNYPLDIECVTHINDFAHHLAAVLKVVLTLKDQPIVEAWIQQEEPTVEEQAMAKQLLEAESPSLILGDMCMQHPHASQIRQLSQRLMALVGGHCNMVTSGANEAGGWLNQATPEKGKGLDAQAMLDGDGLRAYVLHNIEPELDCANPSKAMAALEKAGLVISFTPYVTDTMKAYADFLLPIASYAESDGSYVNAMGHLQTVHAVSLPQGDSKPAWKVLRVFAHFMECEGFDYKHAHEVPVQGKQGEKPAYREPVEIDKPVFNQHALCRYGVWPLASVDSSVRRSAPLQASTEAQQRKALMNQSTADTLGLSEGQEVCLSQDGQMLRLEMHVNDRLPDDMVYVAMGLAETAGFGHSFGEITITRGDMC